MKRIIYALIFAFATSFTFTACTEEEVAPNTENGGGTPEVSMPK